MRTRRATGALVWVAGVAAVLILVVASSDVPLNGPAHGSPSLAIGITVPALSPSRTASPSPLSPSLVPTSFPTAAVTPTQLPSPSPSMPPLPAIPAGATQLLYYHRVQAPPAAFATWAPARKRSFLAYDVLPTAFAAQLDWLVAHGYTTILPRDLAAHWDHGTALPPQPVILTFDDGFHDWVTTVLPALEQHHMVAEFYLTLDAIAHGNIGWAEVRTLARAGNGIGAHDVHHVQLANLGHGRPDASLARMWSEVDGIRATIQAHVGVAPDSMAYVGGGFDARLERLVRKAGYTTARSTIRGIVQTQPRRFELRVVRIGARDDVLDVLTGSLVPALPTFVARMHGVSDLAPASART